MNLKYFKISLACILAPAFTYAQTQPFAINGKVDPSHNGEVVTIVYGSGKTTIKDSTTVVNGTFTIKGETPIPEVAYIRLGKVQPANSLDVYISKGTVMLTGTDSLKYATVSGTKLAEDYNALMDKVRPLIQQRVIITAKYQALPADEKKGEAAKPLMVQMMDVSKQMVNTIYDFINHNPASYVSLDFLQKVSGSTINYETTMPHFEKLSTELQNTEAGKAFKTKIEAAKSMMIGSKAKMFESTTPDGKKLGLQDIISTGKYTLVDFWASWCGPCRKENPNVVSAYATYHDKGFNILSVSLDNKAENWKAAIAKDGMPWFHVSGLLGWKEPAAVLYGISAIPQNVLIDSKGVVVATNLRGDALLNKLKQLLM